MCRQSSKTKVYKKNKMQILNPSPPPPPPPLKASSQTHAEQSDGHQESWERQNVELHQRAAQTATVEEGRQPWGAGSGGLHVLHRYPSRSCRDVFTEWYFHRLHLPGALKETWSNRFIVQLKFDTEMCLTSEAKHVQYVVYMEPHVQVGWGVIIFIY